jgi:hypothetical protein
MGIVMIRCPAGGHDVSTGIEMVNLDQLPNVLATMWCSECGSSHIWSKGDAWLADGGEQYRAAAKANHTRARSLFECSSPAQAAGRH